VPYAIDFLNVAPDMDYYSVGPIYFEWVVENMARLCIERALSDYVPGREYRWDALLNSAPPPLGTGKGVPGFQNTWRPFQVGAQPAGGGSGSGGTPAHEHEPDKNPDEVPEMEAAGEGGA
jgi:hypothetical protein